MVQPIHYLQEHRTYAYLSNGPNIPHQTHFMASYRPIIILFFFLIGPFEFVLDYDPSLTYVQCLMVKYGVGVVVFNATFNKI